MEIKILVPENKEKDLDNFIKDCENKGFELQNRGGGHMPNFSGYYATLKGKNWKPENNEWEGETQIENIKDIAHTEGVLIGLKICKEMWAQGTISHENIQEEIYHYQEELDNLNSNQ